MSNGSTVSLEELEARMAIVRDNIRELVEQAAAFSGAEDEERNAERIAQQNEELDRLTRERDALAKARQRSGVSSPAHHAADVDVAGEPCEVADSRRHPLAVDVAVFDLDLEFGESVADALPRADEVWIGRIAFQHQEGNVLVRRQRPAGKIGHGGRP
jgi:hypothetical protein